MAGVWLEFESGWCFGMGSRQTGVIVVFGGLCIDYISGMVTCFWGTFRRFVTLDYLSTQGRAREEGLVGFQKMIGRAME